MRPADTISAEVAVLEVHATKAVAKLRTTITNCDGVIVLDGEAHVYRDPLGSAAAGSQTGGAP